MKPARYVCVAPSAIQTALWHKHHPSLTETCEQEQGGISAHPADDTKVSEGKVLNRRAVQPTEHRKNPTIEPPSILLLRVVSERV